MWLLQILPWLLLIAADVAGVADVAGMLLGGEAEGCTEDGYTRFRFDDRCGDTQDSAPPRGARIRHCGTRTSPSRPCPETSC